MSTTPEWYLARGGIQEGPLSEGDVQKRIRGGQADADTYAYGPGLTEWTPLSTVPAFAAAWRVEAVPAAVTPAPRAASAAVVQPQAAAAQPLAAAPEAAGGDPGYSLQQFIRETGERDQPGEVFELESKAMLEVHVNGRTWAKL